MCQERARLPLPYWPLVGGSPSSVIYWGLPQEGRDLGPGWWGTPRGELPLEDVKWLPLHLGRGSKGLAGGSQPGVGGRSQSTRTGLLPAFSQPCKLKIVVTSLVVPL